MAHKHLPVSRANPSQSPICSSPSPTPPHLISSLQIVHRAKAPSHQIQSCYANKQRNWPVISTVQLPVSHCTRDPAQRQQWRSLASPSLLSFIRWCAVTAVKSPSTPHVCSSLQTSLQLPLGGLNHLRTAHGWLLSAAEIVSSYNIAVYVKLLAHHSVHVQSDTQQKGDFRQDVCQLM